MDQRNALCLLKQLFDCDLFVFAVIATASVMLAKNIAFWSMAGSVFTSKLTADNQLALCFLLGVRLAMEGIPRSATYQAIGFE